MPPWWTDPAPPASEDTPWNLVVVAVVVDRGDLDEESQVFSRERAGGCTCVTCDDWWSMSLGLFGVDVVVEIVVLCVDGDNDMAD